MVFHLIVAWGSLGVELRSTVEVCPPPGSRKLRRSSRFPLGPAKIRQCQSITDWLIQSLRGPLIHIRSAIACGESLAGFGKAANVWGKFYCPYTM
ncbi:unnamed protein product [Strongylus vulgaris]|uniref:Uncharacterized protein n=1 Tax=Strongylus vulgaris TaxID=40348 RepID=A0A3P7IZ58_STRVU|nr:unnamed protein product [Strongylus vulgaris]